MNEDKKERDAALSKVDINSGTFMDDGMNVIMDLCRTQSGTKVTGEDIRLIIETEGITPHHHNAWGALIKKAEKQGFIHHTNEWRHMKTKKSHARRTSVYMLD